MTRSHTRRLASGTHRIRSRACSTVSVTRRVAVHEAFLLTKVFIGKIFPRGYDSGIIRLCLLLNIPNYVLSLATRESGGEVTVCPFPRIGLLGQTSLPR